MNELLSSFYEEVSMEILFEADEVTYAPIKSHAIARGIMNVSRKFIVTPSVLMRRIEGILSALRISKLAKMELRDYIKTVSGDVNNIEFVHLSNYLFELTTKSMSNEDVDRFIQKKLPLLHFELVQSRSFSEAVEYITSHREDYVYLTEQYFDKLEAFKHFLESLIPVPTKKEKGKLTEEENKIYSIFESEANYSKESIDVLKKVLKIDIAADLETYFNTLEENYNAQRRKDYTAGSVMRKVDNVIKRANNYFKIINRLSGFCIDRKEAIDYIDDFFIYRHNEALLSNMFNAYFVNKGR